MREGWEMRKLGEVCELITKGTTPTSLGFQFTESGVNFIKVESLTETGKIITNKVAFISTECHESLKRSQLKEGDILFSIAGALGRIGIVGKEILPANTNQALAIIRLKENSGLLIPFVARYFNSNIIFAEIEKLKGGAAQQNLSLGQLNNLEIPIPPLPEQQRIVAYLDQTFAKLNQAKANTLQNLQNAKELFETELRNVFECKGEGWEEKELGECFKLKSGDNLTSKMMSENGIYPVFGGNGIAGLHKEFNLDENNVIVGRVGALCGNVRFINEKIWITDNAFKIVDKKFEFDNKFLTYLLNYKNLRTYARQTAQPVISNSSLNNVKLSFPKSLKTQQVIVAKLDALKTQTQQLESVYQTKLNNIEELYSGILKRAFETQLIEA